MWAERGPFFAQVLLVGPLIPRKYETTQLSNSFCARKEGTKFGNRRDAFTCYAVHPPHTPAPGMGIEARQASRRRVFESFSSKHLRRLKWCKGC